MSVEPHGVEAPNHARFVEWYQHGLADSVGDFEQRHDDAGPIGLVDFAVLANPVQVANEAGAPASDQFDMRKPRHIDVGYLVVSAHDNLPSGLVVNLAQFEANHASYTFTMGQSWVDVRLSQKVSGYGERLVNDGATGAVKRARSMIAFIGRFSRKLVVITRAPA